jgi:hypothetical protein
MLNQKLKGQHPRGYRNSTTSTTAPPVGSCLQACPLGAALGAEVPLVNSVSEATPKGGLGTTVQILGSTVRHNGSLLFRIAFHGFSMDERGTPEINMWSRFLAKHQGLALTQANSGSLIKWSDQSPQSVRNQPQVVCSLELVPPKDSPNSVLCIAT